MTTGNYKPMNDAGHSYETSFMSSTASAGEYYSLPLEMLETYSGTVYCSFYHLCLHRKIKTSKIPVASIVESKQRFIIA